MLQEYNNTRLQYDTLIKKSEEAQQAENLERRQKGEQFRVIDPARVPEKPFQPDIPKVLLIGLLAGWAAVLAAYSSASSSTAPSATPRTPKSRWASRSWRTSPE